MFCKGGSQEHTKISETVYSSCNDLQILSQAAQAQYKRTLNYKDLYGNTTDLCKMVETNIVLSIKSTYPAASCIVCHLPAFQADSKRFRRVSVIGVSTAK